MLIGDEVAVVAIYAVVGDAVVDSGGAAAVVVHVALGGPAEPLGTVEARDFAGAVRVIQFDGSEVNCLTVVRSIVVCR
jgi:hypothetical protein